MSIGDPATGVRRVDGRAKVTGAARYAADSDTGVDDLAHAVLIGSPVGAGRIIGIDVAAAEAAPGVLLVLTHENRGPLGQLPPGPLRDQLSDSARLPLADDRVSYAGQHVAMVVAETLEQAHRGASLVAVAYEPASARVEVGDPSAERYRPPDLQVSRGDAAAGLASATVRIDATYTTASEHGCALEPHATVASWSDELVTVREATQALMGVHATMAAAFERPVPEMETLLAFGEVITFPSCGRGDDDGVRVVAPYVGGMFGTKAVTGGHAVLTALAARRLGRPVKTVLTREQVLAVVGPRPQLVQRLELGADGDGHLLATRHEVTSHTSILDDYAEPAGAVSRVLYACPGYESTHEVVRLNLARPGWKRAPGDAPGAFALECAMDELAAGLGLDPIELRRRNHTPVDPHTGRPFSSKHLLACYGRAEDRFGWSARSPEPGSMGDGDERIGWGMATATLPAYVHGATVTVRLQLEDDEVRATVASGAYDAGMGTATTMALTAAARLGLPIDAVTPVLGDSHLPPCRSIGGSSMTASIGPAIVAACTEIGRALRDLVVAREPGRWVAEPGRIVDAEDPTRSRPFGDILAESSVTSLERTCSTTGRDDRRPTRPRDQRRQLTFQSFGAHLVEVRVQPDIGRVRVRRVVSVFDIGRVLNPTSVRGQLAGAIIMGVGSALFEGLQPDPVHGRLANADLAGYLVPVHADVPDIEVDWIGEPDQECNPLGCRGAGEIGIVGLAAAVANAVFHATGRRVRDLPITPERLLN